MKIRVLGSAAGGGFPQWNCGCANCREARRGSPRTRPRTQESVAISADGDTFFLLNASPEIRHQIEAFPALHPRGPRHSPIAGIVLTNGDLDHCLGLLSLRESYPLAVYATRAVRRGFSENNVLYRTLQRFPEQVTWHELALDAAMPLARADGSASGLELSAISAPGKLPIHLERGADPSPEDNVGLLIHESSTRKTLAYFPAVAEPTPSIRRAFELADCIFFEGTFFTEDELRALGLGEKRARDMAHLPLDGERGGLALLAEFRGRTRVLIHINNTNPILLDDSEQAARVRAAGVEIAYDGMEVEL